MSEEEEVESKQKLEAKGERELCYRILHLNIPEEEEEVERCYLFLKRPS